MSDNVTSNNFDNLEPLEVADDSSGVSSKTMSEAASETTPSGTIFSAPATPAPRVSAPQSVAYSRETLVGRREADAPVDVFPFNPPAGLFRRAPKPGPDPFSPDGVQFYGVSPNLLKARVIGVLITAAIFLIPGIVLAYFLFPWIWIYVVAVAAFFAWLLWLIPRQVRALGYAEAESDLLIRSGIMWKSLTVVPYGRLQYVDVSEGPIARAFGISTVQLHTASASTDATIPGLSAAEAARLRTSLAERGQSEMAGI